MKIHCISCGKAVSTEVPNGTILRAVATCPECVEKEPDWETKYTELLEKTDG